LDGAVRGVFDRAETLRAELRKSLEEKEGEEERKKREQRRKARAVVVRVLGTPATVRKLVREGKEDEAKALWDGTLIVLERWKERGVGGNDVQDCIDDGEAALKGEHPKKKDGLEISRNEVES
jgi:predicted N-acetyltransferase YhbS